MAYTLQNNFQKLKGDFKTDTHLDADKNMELYIQYFNARMNDRTMQLNSHMLNEIANQFQHLPGTMRMQMAEMIRALKKEGAL